MLPRSLLVLLAFTVATDLAAQSIEASGPSRPAGIARRWDRLEGSPIRIRTLEPTPAGNQVVEGTLIEAHGDSLYVAVAGEESPRVVVAHPYTIVDEWHREDPTKSLTVLGAVVGFVAGGIVANALNDPPEPRRCTGSYDSVGAALGCAIGTGIANSVNEAADGVAAVLLGGAVGAAVFGLIGERLGQRHVTEGWRTVTLRRLGVRPTPEGGVRVGAQLTF